MNADERIVLIDGWPYPCPPRIQRLSAYNGWQVRYHGNSKFFKDGGGEPAASLRAAKRYLKALYAEDPPEPPTSVRVLPLAHKQRDLPAGVTGVYVKDRTGLVPIAIYRVSLPMKGRPNKNTDVYIGTINTWSPQRQDAALAKAIKLRAAAVAAWGRVRSTRQPAQTQRA